MEMLKILLYNNISNELKKESISGQLLVSSFGGNTANTEFEFLTGLSTAFLPVGSVAYTQYISGSIPSMASHLASFGYKSIAFHPFYGYCWNRELVYPLLGFDDFVSIEDMNKSLNTPNIWSFQGNSKRFGDYEHIRGLLSDGEDYKQIEKMFEEKSKGGKAFPF